MLHFGAKTGKVSCVNFSLGDTTLHCHVSNTGKIQSDYWMGKQGEAFFLVPE